MCVIAPLGPFSDHNDISLPLHIPEMLKVVKLLPFQVNIPEAWKSYPFQAEPFRIGHYRDYSPGELKEKGINHLCHIRWNVCSNLVPRASPLKNRWGAPPILGGKSPGDEVVCADFFIFLPSMLILKTLPVKPTLGWGEGSNKCTCANTWCIWCFK